MLEIIDERLLTFLEAKQPTIRIVSRSNAVRTVRCRGFTKDGTFDFRHTSLGTRGSAEDTFRLPSMPIAAQIDVIQTSVRRGELFVVWGLEVAGFGVLRMGEGYVYDQHVLAWPPAFFDQPVEGRGLIRTIVGTDPAANTEISETVPSNVVWLLKSLVFTLVTDATVASRITNVVLDDGTNVFYRKPGATAQAASLTRIHSVSNAGIDHDIRDTVSSLAIPIDALLFDGYRIRTITTSLQAGDNYGAPVLNVEEFILE